MVTLERQDIKALMGTKAARLPQALLVAMESQECQVRLGPLGRLVDPGGPVMLGQKVFQEGRGILEIPDRQEPLATGARSVPKAQQARVDRPASVEKPVAQAAEATRAAEEKQATRDLLERQANRGRRAEQETSAAQGPQGNTAQKGPMDHSGRQVRPD